MRTLGVGVIGVGMLGRRHAENLARRIGAARLVAVADARPEVARAVAGDLDAPRWYSTAEELAADPEVEAVVIASADAAHAEGISVAARHGKDVLCEKPITTTLADADDALAAVAERNVRLQIGFMRRYDPAYAAAKRQIEAGAIGRPILLKSIHRNRESPAVTSPDAPPDGMVFVNSAIHDVDNARWLLGDEVVAVEAVARQVAAAGDEPVDIALATLHFAGGAFAHIECVSAARYAYDVRAEVVGTVGTVFIGGLAQTPALLATEHGIAHDTFDHWLARFGDTYLIELEDWVRRTLAGEPPAVTGADGRAALEIALAAKRSYQEGHRIELPTNE